VGLEGVDLGWGIEPFQSGADACSYNLCDSPFSSCWRGPVLLMQLLVIARGAASSLGLALPLRLCPTLPLRLYLDLPC